MPVSVPRTTEFDGAIDRLRQVSSAGTDYYIQCHQQRCINDAVQLARISPGGKILNVGGRPYLFECIARQLELDVETVDIAPERDRSEIAELGLTVMAADFERAEDRARLDLRRYDVICLAEIFEHLRIDLLGMFRHLSQLMRPDAVIYLTTPNFYHASRIMKMLAAGRSGPSLVTEWRKLGSIGHMGHVREYARAELVEFFNYAGFEVERSFARNSQDISIREGGALQIPVRLVAKLLAASFDKFAEELVFVLRPRQGGS